MSESEKNANLFAFDERRYNECKDIWVHSDVFCISAMAELL